ncbi:LEAF RUST 10 DISEASE-RESISTANCE LOCUS RECEPTOR-LIKE PROTEIN KINASE-like 2.4 isoform X2 [Capsella rubella]|uniref:LEAF RUST 10 DISEASE-RESISTANCE LOCUS RECEPTOR-LIKE PROTEIN KINASE-like 2.4 isoform X2 n=1 Tax=Capsella rubella TaxID=81985 RepID=UPI000CD525C9|nr:LEAF RUST 10 DISEASE-RESISTANCE LOCUS RECEPTOR-LIKE PROTEIN KINASE-like 2.4 isoform X2 [Capsella rubella]
MYFPLNSCLIFLFLFTLIYHLHYASSKQEIGWCETIQFQCGSITAGFPFWGGNRPEPCGRALLKLHCNTKNITSLSISNHEYIIFHINHTSSTTLLRLVRADHKGPFCSSTFNSTTLPPEISELSPIYKSLTIFYHCNPRFHYASSYTCPRRGVISGYQSPNYHQSCQESFTVNVPTTFVPEKKELNMTHLESVLREGFEVMVNTDEITCEGCSSSRKFHFASFLLVFLHLVNDINLPFAGTVAGVVLFLVLLTLFLRFLRKREKRLRHQKLKALIPLEHYTYTQVKRITKSFAEVVGTGGFGIVYRGTLRDGRMVAVKVLKDSKGNGEDFINEVASMSRTSHHNIVSLLGFCSEGSKRAIIYEFLGNGSLDKFISGKSTVEMDWGSLYRIALGVARGLEYLHHGCKTRIVHFDIKPQNVLLDDNFCPKVSDFGLAKLCEKQESILSMLDTRGTVGYIAPEMISRVYGNVSHKSDVYSYGMLVLDMIGARNKENFNQAAASNTSSMYFPEWVYKDLELGKSKTNIEIEFNSEEDELAKKMTLVGLWCIQPSPTDRPPMNRVVEMMEGSLDALEVPPRPVFQIPTVSLQESSTFSEDTSTYTEG